MFCSVPHQWDVKPGLGLTAPGLKVFYQTLSTPPPTHTNTHTEKKAVLTLQVLNCNLQVATRRSTGPANKEKEKALKSVSAPVRVMEGQNYSLQDDKEAALSLNQC